jgi:hypothetical protein
MGLKRGRRGVENKGMRRALWAPVALVTVLLVAETAAPTAQAVFSGLTSNPDSWTLASDFDAPVSTPTTLASDTFTGSNGTALDSRSLDVGGTWVGYRTWLISSNRAVVNPAASIGNLDVDVGTPTAAVQATLFFGASAEAGLIMHDVGPNALYVEYTKASGGTIILYEYPSTVLGTATGVGTPASATLRVESLSNVIRVLFAGVRKISYSLNSTQITTYKTPALQKYGLWADNDSTTTFDSFSISK